MNEKKETQSIDGGVEETPDVSLIEMESSTCVSFGATTMRTPIAQKGSESAGNARLFPFRVSVIESD